MIVGGKEIGLKKQPLIILKKNVCDDALDLEDMINRNKEFEEGIDNVMQVNVRKPLNNVQQNSNRSLFTEETVRARTGNVKEKAIQADER